MPALKCLREAQQLLLPARIAEFIIYKEYHISRKRQVFLNFQKFPIFHIIKGKCATLSVAHLGNFYFSTLYISTLLLAVICTVIIRGAEILSGTLGRRRSAMYSWS